MTPVTCETTASEHHASPSVMQLTLMEDLSVPSPVFGEETGSEWGRKISDWVITTEHDTLQPAKGST